MLKKIKLKNNQELVLRKPVKEDAKAMISYLNRVGGETDYLLIGKDGCDFTVEQEEHFIENVNNQKNTLMIVGEVDGEIVTISQISSKQNKRIAHTSEIALSVKKAYWRNGIGYTVMKELISFAQSTGTIKVINLTVHNDNVRAINLYRKMGFEEIGLYKKFFNLDGIYYDALLMNYYIE